MKSRDKATRFEGSRISKSWLAVLFLALVLSVRFTPACAALPPVRVDDDHDGIDDALEQKLAERFAPIVFIEPDESNYPVNVDWFLARARLQYHEDCTSDTDDDIGPNPIGSQELLLGPTGAHWAGGPNCGEDDTGYSHPPHHRLTTVSRDPDGLYSVGSLTTGFADQQSFVIPDLDDSYHVGSTDPTEWKTYFHVYPSAEGGVMIQYWHVFAYNELAVGNIGNHGGDWDASIQVQLDADLNIDKVWFSRHSNDHPGSAFGLADSHLHFDPTGMHPLMAIDGGGHAAFADPDDFCGNAAPVVYTQIAWPIDVDNPSDPAKLGQAQHSPTECPFYTNINGDPNGGIGGIVWETWTGGMVLAGGVPLTHPITAPSAHGGMVNLGEYNPCTPATCYGSAQSSTLLAGELHPLNGQAFLEYSGRWGSLPSFISSAIGVGLAPRGPVFQGFVDNGEGNTNVYTAWYNQGSNVPADPSNSPWETAPSTTLSIGSPSIQPPNVNGTIFVTDVTLLTLTATQSSIAMRFGPIQTAYRFFAVSAAAGAYSMYVSPFALAGSDGAYNVNFYSADGLNNQEGEQTRVIVLDTTPPVISITAPTGAAQYTHSATLTLDYTVSDQPGSGVGQVTPKMDGFTTIAGYGLSSGQVINLLTELAVGTHTFTIDAADKLGNASSSSAAFEIIVTADSIKEDVTQFLSMGRIKNAGQANSLTAKLNAAANARASGNCKTAANNYSAFINELQAQRGNGIDAAAADVMIADAQYLIAHCL